VTGRQLRVVSDAPLEPVNLAFDKAGNLLVVSYAGNGTVYALRPGAPEDTITTVSPEMSKPRPGVSPVLPVGDWRLQLDPATKAPLRRTHQYVSPDGTIYISATQGFVEGVTSWGVKSSDLVRAFGLGVAEPGRRVYLTSEAQVTTWSALVGDDGNVSDLQLFVNQGGEGVTTGPDGNVYLAAGDVFVYSPAGRHINTIHVPERPLQVTFGGPDGRTLFMAARHGLYSARIGPVSLR
jgi:SMP-30/Gluconolactonase/LRE-like region